MAAVSPIAMSIRRQKCSTRPRGCYTPTLKADSFKDARVGLAWQSSGDGNGYGYNWGYIGSDCNINNCYDSNYNYLPGAPGNPATLASLSRPAEKLLFADAGFYDFYGSHTMVETVYIDPPSQWSYPAGGCPNVGCNPTIDFRHVDNAKKLDTNTNNRMDSGIANIAWADGHVKPLKEGAFKDDSYFTRD